MWLGIPSALAGRMALSKFAESQIDVALLDVNLGEESRWNTFCRLSGLKPLLPIIAACLMPTGWAQSATQPRLISVTPGNGKVVVRWEGGTSLYQLQGRTNLTAAWEDVGAPTDDTSYTNVLTQPMMFYQVKGSITRSENKAPTIPTGLAATAVGCSQINLAWSPSIDPNPTSGIKGYNVFRGGVFLKQVLAPATITSDTGLAGSTTYTYTVAAIDNAGNQSGNSTAASATTSACIDRTAPSVPTGFAATADSCNQINLVWNASADTGGSGLWGYNIYRNGDFLKHVLAPATSTSDAGLLASTTYTYTVLAFDNALNLSAQSAPISRTTPACGDAIPPSVPTGLSVAAASCNQINLSWNASTDDGGSGLKGYNVYRNGAFLKQVLAPASFTTDTGLNGSTTYSYSVSAVDNADNQSEQTAAVSRMTPACGDTVAPSVPTGLSVTAASCSQINLSWNASTDTGGSGLWGYNVYRDGAFLKQVLAPATSTSDAGLLASTTYTYTILAFDNALNFSAQSAPISRATPACGGAPPPLVPTGLSVIAVSCSQINLSWNAPTDTGGSGLKGYNVYRNGAFLKHVLAPASFTTDTGLNASTTYSYAVAAIDNANNQSPQTAAMSRTTPACADTPPNGGRR